MLKKTTVITALTFILGLSLSVPIALAQWAAPDKQEPSSQEDIKAALSGGVPGGRWKEGLMFEGISPQPWLKSAANWFPNVENVQRLLTDLITSRPGAD